MAICPNCGVSTRSFRKLLKHLKLYHQQTPGFNVTCHLSGCKNNYSKVDSYARHVERCHFHENFFMEQSDERDDVARTLLPEIAEVDEDDLNDGTEELPDNSPKDVCELLNVINDLPCFYRYRLSLASTISSRRPMDTSFQMGVMM